MIIIIMTRVILGGGALPPLHPPYWPAFGWREISGALPFSRLILMIIVIIIIIIIIILIILIMILGGGAPPPPTPPLLAGLRPAGNSRALCHSVA